MNYLIQIIEMNYLIQIIEMNYLIQIIGMNYLIQIIEMNYLIQIIEMNYLIQIIEMNYLIQIIEMNYLIHIIEMNYLIQIIEMNYLRLEGQRYCHWISKIRALDFYDTGTRFLSYEGKIVKCCVCILNWNSNGCPVEGDVPRVFNTEISGLRNSESRDPGIWNFQELVC